LVETVRITHIALTTLVHCSAVSVWMARRTRGVPAGTGLVHASGHRMLSSLESGSQMTLSGLRASMFTPKK